MQFYAVEDHSVAISKPPMLALLTNIGSNTAMGARWRVPRLFSPNAALVDILTCASTRADGDGSVDVVSEYGMPQVGPLIAGHSREVYN
jgi:alpha-amylase